MEYLIVIVINNLLHGTIGIVLIIVRIVPYLRVTRTLTILGSLLIFVSLPDACYLVIPDSTDRLTDKPPVGQVISLFATYHVALCILHILIIIIEVLDGVLVPRQAEGGTPLKVLSLHIE